MEVPQWGPWTKHSRGSGGLSPPEAEAYEYSIFCTNNCVRLAQWLLITFLENTHFNNHVSMKPHQVVLKAD